jgi:hypothetical protein
MKRARSLPAPRRVSHDLARLLRARISRPRLVVANQMPELRNPDPARPAETLAAPGRPLTLDVVLRPMRHPCPDLATRRSSQQSGRAAKTSKKGACHTAKGVSLAVAGVGAVVAAPLVLAALALSAGMLDPILFRVSTFAGRASTAGQRAAWFLGRWDW